MIWYYKSQLVFDCTWNFVDLSANEWDLVPFVWKWDFVNFLHRLPFSPSVALAYVLTVCCNHWAKVSAPGNTLPSMPRRHSDRIPWPTERHVWGKSDSVYLKNNFSDMQNWCNSSHTRNQCQKLISHLSIFLSICVCLNIQSHNNWKEQGGKVGTLYFSKGEGNQVWNECVAGLCSRWIILGLVEWEWEYRRGKIKTGVMRVPRED